MRISDWSSDVCTASLIDVTPVKATDRVVVIGHGTLPMLLAFLRRGCRMAAEFRPDVVAPDAEPADLAWITGVMKTGEYDHALRAALRSSEEHTSELQSLMSLSYAVFCLK